MAGDRDPYVQTLKTIELRRASLSVGAPASSEEGGWSAEEVQAVLRDLDADEAVLRAHWRSATQVVLAGEPVRCAQCGDPKDCSTAAGLFEKYSS